MSLWNPQLESLDSFVYLLDLVVDLGLLLLPEIVGLFSGLGNWHSLGDNLGLVGIKAHHGVFETSAEGSGGRHVVANLSLAVFHRLQRLRHLPPIVTRSC